MSEPPLQRDPALVPLSWGHQRGLRLARHIGLGRVALAELEHAWRTDLDAHFQAEEELLFDFSEEAHRQRVRDDHDWMRATYERFRANPDDAELLAAFGAVLKAHIRFEERVWFKALQNSLGRERLQTLHEQMHSRLPGADGPA